MLYSFNHNRCGYSDKHTGYRSGNGQHGKIISNLFCTKQNDGHNNLTGIMRDTAGNTYADNGKLSALFEHEHNRK